MTLTAKVGQFTATR